MFETFKEAWNKIQQDPPGKRFRRQYRRRKAKRNGILSRIVFVGSGTGLTILGLIMLFTPGPGLFFLFIGLGLISQESLWLSMILDKLEIQARKWVEWGLNIWKSSNKWFKGLLILTTIFLAGSAIYFGYWLIWV